MKAEFICYEGGLTKSDDPQNRLWSMSELWQLWKQDQALLAPFEIVGLANIEPHIKMIGSAVVTKLVLTNELGPFFAPDTFDLESDYVVYSDQIVPIRTEESKNILLCLEMAGLKVGERISKVDFIKLITAFRKNDVPINLDDGLENAIDNAPVVPRIDRLNGNPYHYQKIGIEWLASNYSNSIGSLLCDEMGLGKTYQALGLIAHAIEEGSGPVFVCCPASLIRNWMNEINLFLPSVSTIEYVGPKRHLLYNDLEDCQLVITTYEVLIRDLALLEKIDWNVVIADEAQALKNQNSQRHHALKNLPAESKILITGTPIENHLSDLWALTEIVQPGLLGDHSVLERIEQNSPDSLSVVGRCVGPLILRREVSDVVTDLPPLVVIDEEIEPSVPFAEQYERIRQDSLQKTGSNFLATIVRLQQACCSPSLVDSDYLDLNDAKFIRLSEILDELSEIGRDKVLIFTTFTKSLMMIKDFIGRRYGMDVASIINGSIAANERQGVVDAFNAARGFRVLVINPKAGGAGLNITGANHVIHFNRQWNPAVERQATARAFRRKQEKTVFLHNFFYSRTIEEVIHDRLQGKLRLAEVALENSLSEDDEIYRSMAMYVSPNMFESTTGSN
jgi:SNF2 family DNA or RNA helicase